MGVDVRWYDPEQTLLHISLESPWEWGDLERAIQDGLETTSAVSRPVHVLVEFGGRPARPPQGDTLMHMQRLMRINGAFPTAGDTYLINPNPIARRLIDVMIRLYGRSHHVHLADSLEHALASIHESDRVIV